MSTNPTASAAGTDPDSATAAGPATAPTNASGPVVAEKPLPPSFLAWWTREKIIIAILAVLFLINWWDTRRQVSNLSQEVALRLQAESASLQQQGQLAREAQARVAEAVAKLAAVEAKLADSQSQQAALEALYQDLSRNRDDWALTEIDQTLSLASQQLQLAGNVRGALVALQNADARLGRADKAQFIGVRRALQKDIERLKNLPFIDTSGLAIRLDAVIAGADTLPLIFDERAQASAAGPAARASGATGATGAGGAAKAGKSAGKDAQDAKAAEPSAWQRLRDDAWEQFRQLIRIRDIGDADPVLLNPTQSFFVRENLKLKLLNARIALLQRNESLFKSDVDTAIVWINRYVDVRSRNGASAVTTLRSLSSSAISIELPTLAESINAVRNYKAPRAPGK
jgi:uroporphyrin-3 C-methyltransferase/uroporphyrinogen III methyltransferase/synthase